MTHWPRARETFVGRRWKSLRKASRYVGTARRALISVLRLVHTGSASLPTEWKDGVDRKDTVNGFQTSPEIPQGSKDQNIS